MADKLYKITLDMSDGTEKSVEFTVTDGDPGYTPVKGVDYWTDADQESIVQQVIATLPVYNGEVV